MEEIVAWLGDLQAPRPTDAEGRSLREGEIEFRGEVQHRIHPDDLRGPGPAASPDVNTPQTAGPGPDALEGVVGDPRIVAEEAPQEGLPPLFVLVQEKKG